MEEAAARLGVALIKQYPAREQVELKVRIGCVSKIWARGLAAPGGTPADCFGALPREPRE